MHTTMIGRKHPLASTEGLHADPSAPAGSSGRPLGDLSKIRRGRFLMGIRCSCGKTSLVYAGAVEGKEPIPCPTCGLDLR
ncbi:MAG: hypothetical protein HYT80_03760 [Euryarchaeota archaeon]|nr:hypothetical protein [Euryarchaeota archaeon]